MEYLIIAIIIVVIILLLLGVYSACVVASRSDDQLYQDTTTMNVNRCVCCGEIIPEGRQVCLNCEYEANEKWRN